MISFSDLATTAHAANLSVVDRGSRHWQVRGGTYLVNVYPTTRGVTIYVAGSAKGAKVRGNEKQAIQSILAATENPPRIQKTEKSRRRTGSTLRMRRRLMRKDPTCYWCRSPLVLWRDKAKGGKRFATLDHKMPLGAGGIDNANNQVLACEKCNQEHGDRPGAPIPTKGGGGNATQR